MNRGGNKVRHMVRTRPSWKQHKLLYVVVFAAIAGTVYLWGPRMAGQSGLVEDYTATATLCVQMPVPETLNAEEVERYIASPKNLQRALLQVGRTIMPRSEETAADTAAREAQRLCREVRVDTAETSTPGELRVSITHREPLPQHCTFLVNTLAEQYASDCRAQWKARTQRAYVEAQEMLTRAKEEMLAADERLDAFLEDMLKQREPSPPELIPSKLMAVKPIAAKPIPLTPPVLAAPAAPLLVDNPAWLELSEQLEQIRQRREQLLADRTPQHPQVRQTDLRIAALQRELAQVAPKIPGTRSQVVGPTLLPTPTEGIPVEQAPSPAVELPASESDEQTLAQQRDTARKFRELKVAADRTARGHDRAVRTEREAWRRCGREPRIEIHRAAPLEVAHSAESDLGLSLAAILAGMVGVTGLGMIFAGAAMEPTLGSIEQAEALLGIPVIGAIPEAAPQGWRSSARRRQMLLRAATILGGLLLLAALAAAAIYALAPC